MKGKGRTTYPDESSNPDDDIESNTDDSNTDESSSDEDIKEMMAMLVKGFKRIEVQEAEEAVQLFKEVWQVWRKEREGLQDWKAGQVQS